MVSTVPAPALAGCTELIRGGTREGGPWCTTTSPALPLAWLVYVPVAVSAAVACWPPPGAVTCQLMVADPPAGMLVALVALAGVTVQPCGADSETFTPVMAPGPAFCMVAATGALWPAPSVIGVAGSRVIDTAADSLRVTGRPPT